MELTSDAGLTISVYTAKPGSARQQALDLLASWTATADPTERRLSGDAREREARQSPRHGDPQQPTIERTTWTMSPARTSALTLNSGVTMPALGPVSSRARRR